MMHTLDVYQNVAVWLTLVLLVLNCSCHHQRAAAAASCSYDSSNHHASMSATQKRRFGMDRLFSLRDRNERLVAARLNRDDGDYSYSHRIVHLKNPDDGEPVLISLEGQEETDATPHETQTFHFASALKRLFTRPTQSVWPSHHSAPSLSKVPSSIVKHDMSKTTVQESVEGTTTTDTNTSTHDSLEPFSFNPTQLEDTFVNQTRTSSIDARRQVLPPALALPSCLFSSIRNKLISLLQNPNLSKWTFNAFQLGLAIYLLDAVAKAAKEVLDEMSSDSSSSPHVFNPEQVEQIIASLDPNDTQARGDGTLLLEQTSTWHALASTLLASGMPLRSSSSSNNNSKETSNSVERILLSLTKSEANILQQCLWIPSKKDSFSTIAGLQSIKQSLLDLVWTIKSPKLLHHQDNPYSHLVEKPPGILLYGPPGCGKTMLVKALAASTHIPCLVVTPSVLLRKYVGETNLQVRALFSLAQKLSPCVLCIDELDGLFRERSSTEHDVSRDLKTEFLQWWDGIASNGHILIVGATNRPFEVDSAVLRRMPQSYFVGLPNYQARKVLLSNMLESIPTSSDVRLHPLAAETEGYTPSDLTQVVRMAITTGPVREARFSLKYRPLSMKDIAHAKSIVSPTPLTPGYRQALSEYAQQRNSATTHPLYQGNDNNDSHNINPWDCFFHAGEVHALDDSHFTLSQRNDMNDSQAADDSSLDEDYSYEDDDDDDEESENDL
jgi:SpoVK/Ycf46/Vps4 family AAA+-type ATPase